MSSKRAIAERAMNLMTISMRAPKEARYMMTTISTFKATKA